VFNSNTVVLLPPPEPDLKSSLLITEKKRPSTSVRQGVGFYFFIEVGEDEKVRREKLERREFKHGEDGEDPRAGGFKLIRLLSVETQNGSSGCGSQEASSSSPAGAHGETVAVLALGKVWTGSRHAGTLQLRCTAQSGILGSCWTLMVVIAAVRLFMLHASGRTGKTYLRIGEKIRGE
jgi:hypothetical protein